MYFLQLRNKQNKVVLYKYKGRYCSFSRPNFTCFLPAPVDSGETDHKSASQMSIGTDTAAIFIGTQSDNNDVLQTPKLYGVNLRLPHSFFQNSQDRNGNGQI